MVDRSGRLIWFQHFHKAGGSSLVDLAAANGEALYPRHRNGNPLDERGHEIPLWSFSADRLRRFVETSLKRRLTFVATEWGLPQIEIFADYPEVVLITTVRDPYRRFLSNYRYDLAQGYAAQCGVAEYLDTYPELDVAGLPHGHLQENYYCRVLARLPHADTAPVTAEDLAAARRQIGRFEVVMCLEAEDVFAPMRRLGWQTLSQRSNKSMPSTVQLAKDVARGRWRKAWRMTTNRPQSPPSGFDREFERRNRPDRELYDAFVQRLHTQAAAGELQRVD